MTNEAGGSSHPSVLFSDIHLFFSRHHAVFRAETEAVHDARADSFAVPEEICSKRRDDFISGRVCAAAALSEAGFPGSSIASGGRGEPLWPAGACGSISHTEGLYCAAAASMEHCLSIGLDAEPLARRISPGAFSFIADEDEAAVLAESGLDQIRLFSAKECLYKLLFPLVKVYFSFDAARLLRIDRHSLDLMLTRDLGPCNSGAVYTIHSFIQEKWLLSCAVLPALSC